MPNGLGNEQIPCVRFLHFSSIEDSFLAPQCGAFLFPVTGFGIFSWFALRAIHSYSRTPLRAYREVLL